MLDSLNLYSILLKNYNKSNYPFNLIDNIKDNVINTRKEIELEYSKDLNIFQEKNKNLLNKNVTGKNESKISIYLY
jgi:hypothetical protein